MTSENRQRTFEKFSFEDIYHKFSLVFSNFHIFKTNTEFQKKTKTSKRLCIEKYGTYR